MKNKRYVILFWISLSLYYCIPIISFAQNWIQKSKIIAPDRKEGAYFGSAVSISGNYAIVGSPNEDWNATGADSLYNAGAAYIFVKIGDAWLLQQKIVPSDRSKNDLFGISVAISGNYVVVGAEKRSGFGEGAAYIFIRNGSVWSEQQKITASDHAFEDYFGSSVSISGDYILVGSIFDDHDASGMNSKNQSGSAYLFFRNGNTWVQQQKIVASDRGSGDNFGNSVALSGDYAVVGAYTDGEDSLNTKKFYGSAYVFVRNDATWIQQQKITASDRSSNDHFGADVSINGNTIIIGADLDSEDANGKNSIEWAGSAYFFVLNGSVWIQQQKIIAADRTDHDYFGSHVSLWGNYAVVGAPAKDANSLDGITQSSAGVSYIFSRNGTQWKQQQKLVESDPAFNNFFGNAVAIFDSTVFIGANNDSKGSFDSDSLSGAGSMYIFNFSSSTSVKYTTEPSFNFVLAQNYPNPFNPTTMISYQLPVNSAVSLKVYDVIGKEVSTVVNDVKEAGSYSTTFDGSKLSSGIYFYTIRAGAFTETKKLVLIK